MTNQVPVIEQLTEILKKGLNGNESIRKQAEAEINYLSENQFDRFLFELSTKISNEQEFKPVRQISATLIKNKLIEPKYTEQWFKFREEIRKAIKDNILSTLASSDIDIRKAAALAIAGICKIEIPNKQWLNIFDILCGTAQNENLFIQLSSLTTLEYIFEEIQPRDVPNDIVAKLLNTYYQLLKKENSDPQLVVNVLQSVKKFLPFIGDFIREKNSKKNFYDLICTTMKTRAEEKVRQEALKIFIELGKSFYDSFEDYIDEVFNFSKEIIEKDSEDNKLYCIEIWNTFGYEEEIRMSQSNASDKKSCNFLNKFYKQLSELCLKFVATDNYDNDEYTVDIACLNLIYLMGKTCDYDFITLMLNYLGSNIESNVDKLKYSALNVFKAIIPTKHKSQFFPIVKNSLLMISNILIEPNYKNIFKKLAATILETITEEYSYDFINDTVMFEKMITLFVGLMENKNKEVLYHSLLALNNLCKDVYWEEKQSTNILSKYMQTLSQSLIKICSDISNYDTENNVSKSSFFVLGTLGEKCALDVLSTMNQISKILTETFKDTLDKSKFPDQNIRYIFQEYLTSCLAGYFTTGATDQQNASVLMNLIVESFNDRKELYEDGLLLIANISLFAGINFEPVMNTISQYLIKGLSEVNSPSICNLTLFAVSNIIRGLEGLFSKYANDYLPLILGILSNTLADRNLKPKCFLIISDLFISCPNEAFKVFTNVMQILGGAIQATMEKLNDDTDQDTCTYFINLRSQLIETIHCIFYQVREMNNTKDFVCYVKEIINYISSISSDNFAISFDILLAGVNLIADFCDAYGKDVGPLLNIATLNEIFNKLEGSKKLQESENDFQNFNWAKNTIKNILL